MVGRPYAIRPNGRTAKHNIGGVVDSGRVQPEQLRDLSLDSRFHSQTNSSIKILVEDRGFEFAFSVRNE